MSWQGPEFVIALIAISTFGWVATSWIRARHGYPVEGEWGGTVNPSNPETDRKVDLLTAENERLEQRLRVLERVVTDKGAATADQIEALR